MARAFFLFVILYPWMPLISYGQTAPCDSVYTTVDEMPEFATSDIAPMSYLMKHLTVGKKCDQIRILTWTIDHEGNMINIDAPSLEGECKQKIIDQLKAFPQWKPGKLNGKPVCVKMSFSVCIRASD
jgi:hypothetical protein